MGLTAAQRNALRCSAKFVNEVAAWWHDLSPERRSDFEHFANYYRAEFEVADR